MQQQYNSADKGEPTDYKLRTGPVVDRGCTDILCLLIFIIFSFGLFGIAGYAFKNGDPHRIAQPYDPDHRACGVDGDVADYPYIYFANPTDPRYLYVTTCVKACPTDEEKPAAEAPPSLAAHHLADKKMILECQPNSIVKSCDENLTTTNPEERVIIYNSQLFMNTVCLPTTKAYFQNVKSSIDVETMEKVSNDLIFTKWIIASSILSALVLSFIFLFMIEKCGGCMVWAFILMFLCLLLAGGVMSIVYYYAIVDPSKLPEEAKSHVDSETIQQQAKAQNTDPNNYLYMGFVFFGMFTLFLVIFCCFFSRIRLAIAILETACDYVQDNFTVVLLPVVTFFIMIIYFIFWFVVAVYLFSSGEITSKPKALPFGQFRFTDNQKILANLHLFGLLWNQAFIIAAVEFIIAGSVCIWYFQQGPRGQPGPIPLATSISRFFNYHMGTVAVGSFLLALIFFIRLWLAYLYKHQEDLIKKNKFFEYLFKCLSCCMWCFEKCVQFINKNAYVVCNMNGKSFFPAAKDAVFLILRNPLRFATVGGLGEVFVAIGRAFICLLTGMMCYLILTKTDKFKNDVHYPEAPSFLCAVIGFVIGSTFMAVYGVACDAILLVFIMDEEMEKHNGKGVALSCPPKLEKYLEDS